MKHFLLAITLFLLMSTSASAMAARYYAPPQYIQTSIEITKGDDKTSGTAKNATGSFSFSKSTKSLKSLKLAIDAQSLSGSSSKDLATLQQNITSPAQAEIVFIQSGAAKFDENGNANVKGTLHYKGKRQTIEAHAVLEEQKRRTITFTITLQVPEENGDSKSTLEFIMTVKAIRT